MAEGMNDIIRTAQISSTETVVDLGPESKAAMDHVQALLLELRPSVGARVTETLGRAVGDLIVAVATDGEIT